MEKAEVLKHLRKFLDEQKGKELDKKTAHAYEMFRSVPEEDIVFGEQPKYFFAYMECNSTGVATSTFKGTETQRTVSKDYVTDEYLFIDGHLGAGSKGLSLFYLKPNETINYHSKDDIIKVAKTYGLQLHLQDFRDLNFSLTDHRLNRHKVHVTKGPFTYPIRPIFATHPEKDEKITIGYVYEMDGLEYIIIEPEIPSAFANLKKTGCAPWMFLGFVFPPILFVAGFVLLVQYYKKRMAG